MTMPFNLMTHPDFTVDELISLSGWHLPGPTHRENLAKALDYFQKTVPKQILRTPDDAGPWNLRINGTKFKLLNWLQGIDFGRPVNPNRSVGKGDPLIAYKDPSIKPGQVRGNWYTFPSTRQDTVAIHGSQTRLHKFKAKAPFVCMQSTASDAFVGWVKDLPAEYRHGGAAQLFIWNADRNLDPA